MKQSRWGGVRKAVRLTPEYEKKLAEERVRLERGAARELLNNWHWRAGDSSRSLWLRDALERQEKFYGQGSAERIRRYMREIEDERTSLLNTNQV